MKEDNSQNQNSLSEPETSHQKTSLHPFSSFEEMNEADAKAMADISPLNHLQNAISIIKKVYAEQLAKPMIKILKFK